MNDQEKINAAIMMLRKLQRMVGFFMKKEISELIIKLEDKELQQPFKAALKKEIQH